MNIKYMVLICTGAVSVLSCTGQAVKPTASRGFGHALPIASGQYRPVKFFSIAFATALIPGFVSAYLSHLGGATALQMAFGFCYLFAPAITALVMIYGSQNKVLISDFWNRLSFCTVNSTFLPVIFLFMPLLVLLATAISLLFGKSVAQFRFAPTINFMKGEALLSLFLLFLAPLLEELAWRGYGVDSLRAYLGATASTLLFACLWAVWHLPLVFIKGYYPNQLWNMSIVYVINFFVSMVPGAILLNWMYYANNRSIMAVILFHFGLNLGAVMFQTEQFTKCIVTVLLFVASWFVI